MGPGDLTQVHSSSCAARRDSETVWMAYVPAHILDSAAKRRYRVQGDAGTVATFLITIHVGCLHAAISPAKHAAQAAVLALVFASENDPERTRVNAVIS
jgi:hypothetical protein